MSDDRINSVSIVVTTKDAGVIDALKVIEQDGYVVHLEEVAHLSTDVQHGIRFPDDLIARKEVSSLAVARRAADDALRNAGSPDHVEIVSRSVLYTDWTELE